MCGFLGIFRRDANPNVNLDSLRQGARLMARRGPDDEGVFQAPGVALGHRRLAVIDPVGARQPWVDAVTGTALAYNGEVYNFRDLRRDLIRRGHTFRSESDTEVLLRSYLEWGPACVAQLRGMFAFAVFDPRDRSLLLGRDRFGVKPLFYAADDEQLLFASAVPALLRLLGRTATLNLPAVSHYLSTIRTTFGDQTLYDGIHCLLPGHCLRCCRGGSELRQHQYWEPPVVPAGDKPDVAAAAAAERVRDLVEEAVTEQLVSDVPLGGFVSGGLDSTVIASVASRRTGGRFSAYSVGYDLEGFHEWPFVEAASRACHVPCRQIHLGVDTYPDDWCRLIDWKGLPLSTPNEVPIWHLASALRQEFTVALSGEGSDELFGGYVLPYFSAFDYDRARHLPPPPEAALDEVDLALQQLYGRPYLYCRPDHFLLLNSWVPLARKESLLMPEAWAQLDGDAAMFDAYEALFARFDACTTFDAYLHVHARVNLEGLLFRVDSSTMAASVEGRVPFTDHRLAEYLFGLPDHLKIAWRDEAARQRGSACNAAQCEQLGLLESKVLLRRAFADQVPAAIRERPKMSFPVPFMEWFAGPWQSLTQEILTGSRLRGSLFRPKSLDWLQTQPAMRHNALVLWPVLNLCLWADRGDVRLP